MGNYCRWCGMCNDVGYNDYYCGLKNRFLTIKTVKSWACKSFVDCGIDVITGEDRISTIPTIRRKKINDGEQVKLEVIYFEKGE